MSDCDCCAGIETASPETIDNPQGLTTIDYRVGEHGEFLESMLVADRAFGLRTRETDDFSVALMDAAAVLCDVLTFYQQSFANEHYLRTAKERQSLVGLGQLLGYQLSPGRAASTALAFTLESPVVPPAPAIAGLPPGPYPTPGAVEGVPASVLIPTGTKVQSVPGPGQTPQIFESIEDITARPEWNSIPLRATAAFGTASSFASVELQGFVSAIKPGDLVLLTQAGGSPIFNQVKAVDTQTAGKTVVTFTGGSNPGVQLNSVGPAPTSPPPNNFDKSYVASAIRGRTWNQADFEALADNQRWDTTQLQQAIRASLANDMAKANVNLSVLGASAALFGHNAASFYTQAFSEVTSTDPTTKAVTVTLGPPSDADATIGYQYAGGYAFYLDNPSTAAVPGKWIVLDSPNGPIIATVGKATDLSVSLFGLRGRTTKVSLPSSFTSTTFWSLSLRQTRVLIETATIPVTLPSFTLSSGNADAGGGTLRLDGPYFGLRAGQDIVVMGEPTSLPGQTAFEATTIAGVVLEDGYTVLTLSNPLTNRYTWSSVRVLANVADATHGESVTETLGAGDATKPFQKFALKQGPLTWVSASVPSGILPAITVRVNGIAWARVDNLFAAGPQDRVYTLQTSSDGTTWVCFGDGTNGARLPTAAENIQADYRRGIGAAGNLLPGQLSLALSRPLGLSSVVNPVAATGGGAPETLEEARLSMPYPMKTLGRIVTVQDYEDFVRASAGVAKSKADWLWDGHRWIVLVTIAGPNGATIPVTTPAYKDLLAAMQDAGDDRVPSAIVDFQPAFFDVDASLTVDPTYVAATVLAAAQAALRVAFGFTARAFMQPVFLSDVISVLQNVAGVVAVDVNALYRTGTTPNMAAPPSDSLTAAGASASGTSMTGAELLTIQNGPLNRVRVLA